ncbi:MAG: MFS transporter [Candidatus Spechtbacterales bacterium]
MQLRFYFIYLTVFLNVMAFTLVFPLLPAYAKTFDASALQIGLLAGSFGLAQLFFAPIWGRISDRIGRKPTILMGVAGLGVGFVLFGLAGSLSMLFVARFLQGIFSGASLPSARAYVADLTDKTERVRAMGRIGASLALGVIMGPFIGGILASAGLPLPFGMSVEGSLALPFFAAAVLAALNLLLVVAFLPESLPKRAERLALREGFVNITKLRAQLRLNSTLTPFLLLAFVWSFAISNNQVVVPLLGESIYGVDAAAMGLLFGLMGLVSFVTQLFLLSRITRLFGERRTVVIGLGAQAFAFSIMPFMPVFSGVIGTAMFAALGSSMARPVITALASEETTEGQGTTMGLLTSMEAIGRASGPFLGGVLFGVLYFVPFLFSALVVAVSLVFIIMRLHFFRRIHHHPIA